MPSLNRIDKEKIISHHVEVSFRVLGHRYGFDGDNPEAYASIHSGNKIIHDDNLAALRTLLPEYKDREDCIVN